ncbi:MAG: AGE family epimerase/isomerase [Anaerolineae bacterium]|nr:AGE family epimerase/isomerase [Anaerolineae bacterium]
MGDRTDNKDRHLAERLVEARLQLREHLVQGIIPFWAERGVDQAYGGYLTCFDADGKLIEGETDKHIVTQTRQIWGFSLFHMIDPANPVYLDAARQGVDFFIEHFWDGEHGGWNWLVQRDGTLVDDGKVVYGQSFAIYALATYTLATGDARGLAYAEQTFDLLQRYCVDTARGGYYENLEPDWQLSPGGHAAGDRKSLDIHMHLLEAFTVLAQASGKEIHRRRLQEVIDVILKHMIDPASGCGGNQYDLAFNPIPAIAIRRTFNADREGDAVATPTDTTSYGHNVELAWLLVRAGEVLGKPRDVYAGIVRRLVDHALTYGLDHERGGVYRDGPHDGPPLVRDKEFWQNAEVLVGFLDAFELTGDPRYAEAFLLTWDFVRRHMINHELGEWMTLVSETGEPLVAAIGSPWKACYHSGRAVYEALRRIDAVTGAAGVLGDEG